MANSVRLTSNNKHTLLNERYRPSTLDGYVGNEQLKTTIAKSLEQNDIQNYLFHGQAGTGKTTLAKIVINNLDCESLYINASDGTNPGTLLGFGTWVAFGAGRVPVGIDATQTEFDTAEETGGAKTHTLSISEMPSHTHNLGSKDSTAGDGGAFNEEFIEDPADTTNGPNVTSSSTGGGSAHNNLQPYIVVYMWKRTL